MTVFSTLFSFPRFGAPFGRRRAIRGCQRRAIEIRRAEKLAADLSDTALQDEARRLCDAAGKISCTDQISVLFAGLVAEAVFRVNGFRLFDVQMLALAAGSSGAIVEMQTGEGKTVVTGAIAAVQCLTFPTVHVGTTNTYLAARDLESMAPVFELLGLTWGLLPEEYDRPVSRQAYRSRIVYGPGFQYGFYYLTDQMTLRQNRRTHRGAETRNRISGRSSSDSLLQTGAFHAAIIDEADSVMIDEAMTPLIISVPVSEVADPKPYLIAKKMADDFVEGQDFHIPEGMSTVVITDDALRKAHADIARVRNLQLKQAWRTYVQNAVRAKCLLKRNKDYVVRDNEIQIVDPYTGRIQPDRTWQQGLHQAVEARENVPFRPGRDSTTQITRQRYLQLYGSLTGLTGTASAVAREFQSVYGCPIVEIPTHRPCRRKVLPTRFFADSQTRYEAIARETTGRHQSGQPVLVGTRTIQESLDLCDVLTAHGLAPTVLNGIQDDQEADIVSRAGQTGAVTIATNMAGRGTDIKPDQQALDAGGLHVIGASPNFSTRTDRQLAGRAARQGQPGSVRFYAAATDEIFTENRSELALQIRRSAKGNGEADDFSRQLQTLQRDLETQGFQQRQDMIRRDRWMDTVRNSVEKS